MAAKLVKLYPHPDLLERGGIPRAGEWFTAADARRLVGQGLAVREAPVKRTSRTPAAPAREG